MAILPFSVFQRSFEKLTCEESGLVRGFVPRLFPSRYAQWPSRCLALRLEKGTGTIRGVLLRQPCSVRNLLISYSNDPQLSVPHLWGVSRHCSPIMFFTRTQDPESTAERRLFEASVFTSASSGVSIRLRRQHRELYTSINP